MTFSPDVYEAIREGAMRSARAIVPLVYDLLEPRTVVDVGCGEGFFAREFAMAGCKVLGIDESIDQRRYESFAGDGELHLARVDLAADARPDGRGWAHAATGAIDTGECSIEVAGGFDLAVCLEVAEHLPESSADSLIVNLCAVAPVVLFSAAIPGQGGHGHVNEQWPGYWVRRFEQCGFEVSGELRWHIWGSEVEPWYQQNLLVAAHRDRVRALLSDRAVSYGMNEIFGEHAFDEPIAVVHPTTFSYWVDIAKGRR